MSGIRRPSVPVWLSKWVSNTSASTTTEYAIILGLVATALVLAGQTLSDRGKTPADFVAFYLTTGDSRFDGRSAPGSAQTGFHAPRGAGRAEPRRGTGDPSPTTDLSADQGQGGRWPAGETSQRVLLLAAWGSLLVAGGLLVYQRQRKARMRRQVRELDLGDEPSKESTPASFVKRQEIRRVLLKHLGEVLQSRVLVRHVMSRRVRAVEPSASTAVLREIMTEEGFHHLLVMEHGKLLGVLSDRDLCGRCGKRASELMTRQPLTTRPDTPIGQAITSMLRHRISCLPVVEEEAVQGILTTTDMLLTLQCLLQLLEQAPALAEGASPTAASREPVAEPV